MNRVLPILLAASGLAFPDYTARAVTLAASATPSEKATNQQMALSRSASAMDIVKLKKAGLDASVIKAFIDTYRVPYVATMEDILYLHENQVPQDLITAWMRKGGELVERSQQAAMAARNAIIQQQNLQQAPVTQQQQPQVVYGTAPAPSEPAVVYAAPSYYASGYYRPYYSGYSYYPYYYPYYSWPYFSFYYHNRHGHGHYGKHYGHYSGYGFKHYGGRHYYKHHGGHYNGHYVNHHGGGRYHAGFRHGGHGGSVRPINRGHNWGGGGNRFASAPRAQGGGFRSGMATAGFRSAPSGGGFRGGGGGMRFAGGGGRFRGGGGRR